MTTKQILFLSTAFALGIGAIACYLLTQPRQQISSLTLANIEAVAIETDCKENGVKIPCKYTGNEYDHCSYIVITTDGKSKPEGLDGFVNDEILN